MKEPNELAEIWIEPDKILSDAFDKIRQLIPDAKMAFFVYNRSVHYMSGNTCPHCAAEMMLNILRSAVHEHNDDNNGNGNEIFH